MIGFLYFACILTGTLSGGAIGMIAGQLIANSSSGKWPGAVVGAVVCTYLLLRLGRKLHQVLNAPGEPPNNAPSVPPDNAQGVPPKGDPS